MRFVVHGIDLETQCGADLLHSGASVSLFSQHCRALYGSSLEWTLYSTRKRISFSFCFCFLMIDNKPIRKGTKSDHLYVFPVTFRTFSSIRLWMFAASLLCLPYRSFPGFTPTMSFRNCSSVTATSFSNFAISSFPRCNRLYESRFPAESGTARFVVSPLPQLLRFVAADSLVRVGQ